MSQAGNSFLTLFDLHCYEYCLISGPVLDIIGGVERTAKRKCIKVKKARK